LRVAIRSEDLSRAGGYALGQYQPNLRNTTFGVATTDTPWWFGVEQPVSSAAESDSVTLERSRLGSWRPANLTNGGQSDGAQCGEAPGCSPHSWLEQAEDMSSRCVPGQSLAREGCGKRLWGAVNADTRCGWRWHGFPGSWGVCALACPPLRHCFRCVPGVSLAVNATRKGVVWRDDSF
jgi:hypothetical protein